MQEISLHTSRRSEFVEITEQVQQIVSASGVTDGICVVYCPHTTAGITINENADPDVVHDILLYLDRTIPQAQPGFRHAEGNSDSHIKASFVGSSATILIESGRLALGTWQGIYFCEFDGPRRRRCWVKIIPAAAGRHVTGAGAP